MFVTQYLVPVLNLDPTISGLQEREFHPKIIFLSQIYFYTSREINVGEKY